MKWTHWLGLAGSAFVTGLGGWATSHLASDGVPTTAAQLKGFGLGALLGGVVAVANLFRQKPGTA